MKKNYNARPVFEHKWKIYYSSPNEYMLSEDLTNDVKYCTSRYEVQEYLDIVNSLMEKVNGSKDYKYVIGEEE